MLDDINSKKNKDLITISVERKKDLKEKVMRIRNAKKNKTRYREFTPSEITEIMLYYFKKEYKEQLNSIEKSFIVLTSLVPDDNEFYHCCQGNKTNTIGTWNKKYDFDKIASIYGITAKIAKDRYKLMLENFRDNLVDENEDDFIDGLIKEKKL